MRAIIILNGELKDPNFYTSLIKPNDYVICADGGINNAELLKIHHNIITGAMESADPKLLKKYKNILEIDKNINSTDGEKATEFAINKNPDEIIFICAQGKRLDHTLGNINLLQLIPDKIKASIQNKNNKTSLLQKSATLNIETNKTVSFFPLTKIENLTLTGFKYSLENHTAYPGKGTYISNISTRNIVSVEFDSGKLIMIEAKN